MYQLLNDMFVLAMWVQDCNQCSGRWTPVLHPSNLLFNMSMLVLVREFHGSHGFT